MIRFLRKREGGIFFGNAKYCYYQYLLVESVSCCRCKKNIEISLPIISILGSRWIHFPDCLSQEELTDFESEYIIEKLKI